MGVKVNVVADTLSFLCPGCNEVHSVNRGWSWNNSTTAPTFSPSILVTSGHFSELHKPGGDCWCTFNAKHPDDPSSFVCFRCHSFVTDGKIQFLGDCTHKLANQTVDLPDWHE